MIASETVQDCLRRAFAPTQRGIVGLTEQLLEACVGGDVEFKRVGDRCVCRWTLSGETQEATAPLPPAAFRTMLARVAVLCNERIANSVSPYGGEGELTLGANPPVVFKVKFTNTIEEQKLQLSMETGSAVGASEQEVSKIVTGRVANIVGTNAVVDVGFKNQGIIPLQEWSDESIDGITPPQIGDEIQVLLDGVDESGAIILSFRKAKRQMEWEAVLAKYTEGDVVSGLVTRKIRGGLLVNIGVNVFLPASQIDICRPTDIPDYVGKIIECKILKIDKVRRNIVVSRRKLLEERRNTDTKDSL